ncbi:MAG: retropepsin-like aspartic protease [Candidatus Woesearchaeota archaeon]
MTLSYKYKIVERRDLPDIKSPSIPIRIIAESGGTSFDTLALIDSGADLSVITKDIAEVLNLNLDVKETTSIGIGGKVRSKETTMNIRIGHDSESYTLRIPVMVVLDHIDFSVLLGRKGFFDKFKIEFDQRNEKVLLKKNN